MTDERVPTDEEVRLAMFAALQQMLRHSEVMTEFTAKLDAGLTEAMAVAAVVNDNEDQALTDRQVSAQKELIAFLFEKSHGYVATIIAGAFAAYFATLGVLSERFSDNELRVSALLMTLSLTAFVLWEVSQMIWIGRATARGELGRITQTPEWMKRGWGYVMIFTLVTAVPAVGLSLFVYLRGLGAGDVMRDILSRLI